MLPIPSVLRKPRKLRKPRGEFLKTTADQNHPLSVQTSRALVKSSPKESSLMRDGCCWRLRTWNASPSLPGKTSVGHLLAVFPRNEARKSGGTRIPKGKKGSQQKRTFRCMDLQNTCLKQAKCSSWPKLSILWGAPWSKHPIWKGFLGMTFLGEQGSAGSSEISGSIYWHDVRIVCTDLDQNVQRFQLLTSQNNAATDDGAHAPKLFEKRVVTIKHSKTKTKMERSFCRLFRAAKTVAFKAEENSPRPPNHYPKHIPENPSRKFVQTPSLRRREFLAKHSQEQKANHGKT